MPQLRRCPAGYIHRSAYEPKNSQSDALDGDGLRHWVRPHEDLQVAASAECVGVRETHESDLVEGVRAVADKLAQEDVAVGVQAVHDHIHEPVNLDQGTSSVVGPQGIDNNTKCSINMAFICTLKR